MGLDGKAAVVTGAGSGIGAAIAHRFAADGASVLLADIDVAGAEQVASDITAVGGTAAALRADTTSEEDVRALVASCIDRFGGLDVLVNNVGIFPSPSTVIDISEDDWDRTWAINVKSGFLCSKHAITHMVESSGGVVLFTSSGAGLHGAQGNISYCATKAAIISMVKTMALDHGRQRVRVNCICPGPTLTPTVLGDSADDELLARRASVIPLDGGMAQPEEIAAVFAFLASDEASYVTGQAYVADGGMSAGMFSPAPATLGVRA